MQLPKREPDFEQFLRVLTRQGRPAHLPFYEHLASTEFIARHTGIPLHDIPDDSPQYWKTYVDFWLDLNFDCIPLEVPLNCPLAKPQDGCVSHGSEAHAVIHSVEDFERYPWPDLSAPIDVRPFEWVANLLPDGARIVGGVAMGPFEWVSHMMGMTGMSLALKRTPDLVAAMFEKIGTLIVSAARQLVTMDAIGALRQGDDLGFKTATFLSPADLREFVFPAYRRLVSVAHESGRPFILHSCGNLASVYDDLIDDVGIDAKHSFEEVILPVEQFKRQYGSRVTPLGGLDVDLLCRGSEREIRRYAREKIEACFADGYYALGTGNSLTAYLPVENYLFALDEGMQVAGAT